MTERKDEFYTLLVFKDISARHSGHYTCSATNSAAQVNFTSEMLVKVPPRWKAEPRDTALMLGNAMAINCEADGYPEPVVIWSKAQGRLPHCTFDVGRYYTYIHFVKKLSNK